MNLPDLAALVREAPAETLPNLIGQFEQAKAVAWARLTTSTKGGNSEEGHEAERQTTWITPEQAAAMAGVKVKRIYEWARGQRWASRPTKRCLRIEEAGFRRWLATR